MNGNKLDIQWFIEQHRDWETLLSEKPYCITVTRDKMFGKNLVMFKYSQIDSDFTVGLVRECRGLILDEDTLEPVCVPFFKFGNYGENYCPEIDWKSCWVESKIDGSLIKVVRIGNDILVSTNGTIDAFKAPLAEQIGCTATSFGGLVQEALIAEHDRFQSGKAMTDVFLPPLEWLRDMLEEHKTYMFEITSPFNKIVVSWPETRLYFLGVRDNRTFQEEFYGDHPLSKVFSTPKLFPLTTIDECIEAAKELPVNEEGYVVCDLKFNRVKVKSPTYVNLHHLKNNGVLSFARGIDLVRGNELGEVLTYFPEFAPHLDKIRNDFENTIASLESAWKKFEDNSDNLPTRKDQAMFITNKDNFGKNSGIGFCLLDKKVGSVREWFMTQPTVKVMNALGYKDKEQSES